MPSVRFNSSSCSSVAFSTVFTKKHLLVGASTLFPGRVLTISFDSNQIAILVGKRFLCRLELERQGFDLRLFCENLRPELV